MASPNSAWTEALTHTLYNRTKKLSDNYTNNVALYKRLSSKGRVKTADGGVSILQELAYAQNSTAMWYDGYESLNINPSDIATAAEFAWKQLNVAVIMSGKEMMQNSGKERMISLIASRVENAEKTMINTLGAGVYADGTGTSGKEMGGLTLLVADTNTNTVGGISGSTYSWWKNLSYDLSSVGSTASTTNIQTHMNNVYVQLKRNNEGPDLILADNNYYSKYLGSLQTIQRITRSDGMASAGFTSLAYMDADVVLDGGRGGSITSNRMYFLNTDYIFLRPHADRNIVPLDPDRHSVNQDAVVKHLAWMGNMTISNRFMQAVMKA